jgi:hypothetical protein
MDLMMDRPAPMFSRALLVAFASLTLGVLTPVFAQQTDPDAAALAEMLKALTVPGAKGAPPGGGTGAAEVDQQVRALTGSPQLTQEVYNLAAQVLAELMQTSGGDMGKVFDTLERAKSDPAAFMATLSPQTRDRLKELSDKIAATRP